MWGKLWTTNSKEDGLINMGYQCKFYIKRHYFLLDIVVILYTNPKHINKFGFTMHNRTMSWMERQVSKNTYLTKWDNLIKTFPLLVGTLLKYIDCTCRQYLGNMPFVIGIWVKIYYKMIIRVLWPSMQHFPPTSRRQCVISHHALCHISYIRTMVFYYANAII